MCCKYCEKDRDGYVSFIPKKKGNGKGYVWDAKLKVIAPYGNVIEYEMNYCPMCGRKLRERVE